MVDARASAIFHAESSAGKAMKVSELPVYIRQANEITFIIGAGASKSAGIPLASGLIKLIEDQYGHCLRDLSDKDRKNYGRVMSALSPQERKNLIEPLLNDASLNWGHVALASIVKQANVKRILSFNFDFLLERAFSLLGGHLPVYDFGIAPASNVSGLADKAIFHLHGQSYGLKLLNSDEEMAKHAESLRPLLRDSLCNHVTIVSGYSGAADGAFRIMLEAYNGDNRLFWLGHNSEPTGEIAPIFENRYAEYIGGCDFDLSMIEIARWLKCWPLPILENPPLHVAAQLKPLPSFPVGEEGETAVLHETRLRLERISKEWDEGRSDEEREASALIANLEIEEKQNVSEYSEEAKDLRSWRLLLLADTISDEAKDLNGEVRAQKFQEAGDKYAEAVRIKPDKHEAFYNWGNALSAEAETLKGEARAQKYREAGEKYAEAVRLKPDKLEAFNNWGVALSDEAESHEGEARAQKYWEAGEKFAEAVRLKPDKHEPFYNWGNALSDEAETLKGEARAKKYREAGEKFAETVRLKPDDYEAFNNWGVALSDEAKALKGEARAQKYREAGEKFAEAVRIKPDKHEAFNNWGIALSDVAEALKGEVRAQKFLEAGEKFAEAVRLKPDKHEAFKNWGVALSDEAETLKGEARAKKYREAGEKFAETVRLKPDDYEAFNNWGVALSDEAEALKGEVRAQKYREAGEKYAEAVRLKPDDYEAFCNWGNALSDESETLKGEVRAQKYREAGEKFAEAVRLKPDDYEAFNNWGIALSDEAKALKGEARAQKYREAGEKFAEAVQIKPDDHEAFRDWGFALLKEATGLNERAREQKLAEAHDKLTAAKCISQMPNYNLACVFALTGKRDLALDELEACRSHGSLPNAEHLRSDSDLDGLRDSPRFIALLG